MSQDNDQLLKDYLRLEKKLKEIYQKGGIEDFHDKEIGSAKDILKNCSSVHHYIPKYFNDGFLDDDGLMFVYDKQQDRIKLNKQGSKGVFFEINRNNVDLGLESPVSIMEQAYAVFDRLIPASIKLLRSDIELAAAMRIDLHAHLNIFIIDLYWRNINNDHLFDALYDLADLTMTGPDGPINLSADEMEYFKQVPFMKQLMRFKMVAKTLEAITNPENGDRVFATQTITFPLKQLCIGDMPYLFKNKPVTMDDLLNVPMFFPLSSHKLYLRNVNLEEQIALRETNMFNALVIHQSSKMICAADKKILESAIAYYHSAKALNLFDYFKNCLFNSPM